ncbi:MAG: putative ribonuclease [Candidatus Saccharibacteria bacterium]|nr:putative ribonuclease [Candidatus Saccharibacteria bacterium]
MTGTLYQTKAMNIIEKSLTSIDSLQRRYRLPGFIYAVIKKYGEDKVGYQAALLTYYGFLALFPLLLVLTTVAGIVATNHPGLKETIIDGMTNYFPVLGSQLTEHVNTFHRSGLALIVGILFVLYGTRGVVDVFRHGVNHIWHEPDEDNRGFFKNIVRSFGIMFVGGFGLLGASIIAGFTAAAGHGVGFRILSSVINLVILFGLFVFLINVSLPRHITVKHIRKGAASAAIGLVVLQSLSGYVLTRELRSLDALYSYFAISLGLLFWIYLQAQVLYYSITIAAVDSQKLWPRSLTGKDETAADMRAKK